MVGKHHPFVAEVTSTDVFCHRNSANGWHGKPAAGPTEGTNGMKGRLEQKCCMLAAEQTYDGSKVTSFNFCFLFLFLSYFGNSAPS